MEYDDSLEKSSEYLRLALDYMGRHQIPVDPVNYSVWYEYVSGRNEELRNTIDGAISQSRDITPEFSRTLYERYIANEHKIIIRKIREELHTVLDTLLIHMVDSGGRLARFGTMLQTYSQRLDDDLDAQGVRDVVNDILTETKGVRKSGQVLRKQIVSSAQEIENLRKDLDKLKEEVDTDILTGLKNRRYLSRAFELEADHARRSCSSLSLLMIDIDHFKRINDNYGHIVGDQVLKTSAAMITECVKGRDMVVRFGGEEFIVLLPNTPLRGAIILAEQICSYFKNMNWKCKGTGQVIGQVCVSIGVSQYRPGESLEALIDRADGALHLSKKNGRCRVTAETEPSLSRTQAQS